jgi:serine protease Do
MPLEGFGEIAEKLRRATVQVSAGRRGGGSGIIVKPEGVIVTNAHVVSSGSRDVVSSLDVHLCDGTRAKAEFLAQDRARDLALLRIAKHDLPAAPLADSDLLRVGELVIAIGNPFGFIGALTTGIVHAVGPVRGLGPRKWIQSDVQLAPGNSGGPLANAQGHIIGINTMIAGGIGLAIPSNAVRRLLQGSGQPAFLGVVVQPVRVTIGGQRQTGLLIMEVGKGGAADLASLMLGDILVGVEGQSIRTLNDFEKVFDGAGERLVRLQFLRGDRTTIRTVAVRLGYSHSAAA